MRSYAYLKELDADSLTLQESDVPRPGPGQVLVRMKAASLNYRDLLIITGRYPGMKSQGLIPVSDGAGVVADSKPEAEYQETLNKARGMLKALACLLPAQP